MEVFYNRQRRHSTLDNISPAEFERRYAAEPAAVYLARVHESGSRPLARVHESGSRPFGEPALVEPLPELFGVQLLVPKEDPTDSEVDQMLLGGARRLAAPVTGECWCRHVSAILT